MHRQSLELFVNDLKAALAAGDLKAIRSRVALFELMYLSDNERMRDLANHKVLVLRGTDGELYIFNEYYPNDNGRVHLMPDAQYGTFRREHMQLDIRKVLFDIAKIEYEGDDWPSDMGDFSVENVYAYFN